MVQTARISPCAPPNGSPKSPELWYWYRTNHQMNLQSPGPPGPPGPKSPGPLGHRSAWTKISRTTGPPGALDQNLQDTWATRPLQNLQDHRPPGRLDQNLQDHLGHPVRLDQNLQTTCHPVRLDQIHLEVLGNQLFEAAATAVQVLLRLLKRFQKLPRCGILFGEGPPVRLDQNLQAHWALSPPGPTTWRYW